MQKPIEKKTENELYPPFTITPHHPRPCRPNRRGGRQTKIARPTAMTPKLKKADRIKTITGTLAIEGNTLGIDVPKNVPKNV